MSQEKSSYALLIEKLDQFIRKYYINQLVRGLLYSVGLIVLAFLIFSLAEHFFYFGTSVRKILFFSFLLISGAALFQWMLLPIIHYFRLGKVISHDQAADIIGNHFADVRDKLINILQLNRQLDQVGSKELINASITQKTAEIQPIPFQAAIDLGKNRKYLPYALPPLLILLGILIGAPSLIKDPAHRIIRNNAEFERAAPFYYQVINESLEVPQYEDFKLSINIEGDYLPEQAFVDIGGFKYRMKKEGADQFSYVFNNVQSDQEFKFTSEGVISETFVLSVLKKPNILDFQTQLDYPAYTKRRDETLSNVGDLVIPQGTKIDWIIQSVNTEQLHFSLDNGTPEAARNLDQDTYTISKRIYKNQSYKMIIGNTALPKGDSISYVISVVPDLYPTISLKQFVDSSDQKMLYLVGDASDDYGLKRLTFNYSIINNGALKLGPVVEEMEEPANRRIGYDRLFDINQLDLAPGDEVTYFFEVWDNDAVSGSKSSRTSLLKFAQPTIEEFEKKEDENEESIKQALEKAKNESKKIKEDFKSLREKMLQEKSLDWQMKKELENLLDRQESLENELENAKEKFQENLENQQEFAEPTEEMLEKQEKLEELFEELADEETRELMEKIRELMEELNKDEALQMMEEMEINEEELSLELERLKELFKQLELERDLKQEIDKLQELGEKQEELSEETREEGAEDADQEDGETQEEDQDGEDQNGDQKDVEEKSDEPSTDQSLEEQQEEINEEFKDIQEALEELEKKNEELQSPKNLGDNQDQMDDIQQDLDQSLDQLQKNQKSNASKSQKNAGQKMQQMAQQMQEQMQGGEMEQMEEDMQAMRQLLENLVGLSFDQEDLMENLNRAHTSTPKYTELVQHQHKLEDDFHLIEDSLLALSQRVYQIESFVLEKVSEIKGHMGKSLRLLEDRKKAQASDNQQRTMKNVNDLALMFSESMNQMQQQMAAMMSGSQMCTKPGGAKPKDGQGNVPMDKISEGQKGLNGEMQQMKEGMKDGSMKEGGTSKEFAQMAAKQAALRKALRDIQKQKQAQGKGSKELEEILQEMDKIETDLVNKRLTNEMLKRQEDILTRLLESERAEREREYENKRESNTAEEVDRPLPPSVEKYIKEREAQIEPFKTVSPALKPYYKQLVEEYYKSLKDN